MMSRRHNDPQTPHERARALASDRLDAPLEPHEAAWLEDHLDACDACRSIAEAYAANRDSLRFLPAPDPPRDLWARTAAALDRERARRSGVERGGVGQGRRRPRWGALAGLGALIVVGVVVGRTILPAQSGGTTAGNASPVPFAGASPLSGPAATPLAVVPSDVAWVAKRADGTYGLNLANVAEVCPAEAAADCAPLDSDAREVLAFDQRPSSVALAPASGQAAVVEAGAASSGGSILVVPFSEPQPTASPSSGPTSSAPIAPTASPEATAAATAEPSPSRQPSAEPTPSAEPSPTASATVPTASAEPSASPVAASLTPTGTPAPTAAAALAIISDVVVVGGDPAYSADGRWLAFSARPASGDLGPDIYVWQAGDAGARPLTTDHDSIFSSWVEGSIVGSRANVFVDGSDPNASRTGVPVSFLVDPTSGQESTVFAGWRPVVDPRGRWVVYWTGPLRFDETAHAWTPDHGQLEIASWVAVGPDGAGRPDGRPLLDPAAGDGVRAWITRWDPTGRYVGVWVADPLELGLGRLSLVAIDPATGTVDRSGRPVLRDAPSLAAFAIGNGRIAWATPPGQDGDGSRLQVLAWKGPDAGKITTEPAPAQEDILVAH